MVHGNINVVHEEKGKLLTNVAFLYFMNAKKNKIEDYKFKSYLCKDTFNDFYRCTLLKEHTSMTGCISVWLYIFAKKFHSVSIFNPVSSISLVPIGSISFGFLQPEFQI
jgi:hypothetical protein